MYACVRAIYIIGIAKGQRRAGGDGFVGKKKEKSSCRCLLFSEKVIPLHADYYLEGMYCAFAARVDSLSFGREDGP